MIEGLSSKSSSAAAAQAKESSTATALTSAFVNWALDLRGRRLAPEGECDVLRDQRGPHRGRCSSGRRGHHRSGRRIDEDLFIHLFDPSLKRDLLVRDGDTIVGSITGNEDLVVVGYRSDERDQ